VRAAFQIRKHDVGGVQLGYNVAEGSRGIGDVLEIDIAGLSLLAISCASQ
jgi:hypothetical protein